MFKNYFTAMCMPILMVCIFNVYTTNIYISIVGALLIAVIIFLSHRTINGMPFSKDDVLEDKDIKTLLNKKEAFTEEEYKEISKPDYWLGILTKTVTYYAHQRNTIIVMAFGLILYFFFSERTPIDGVVYLCIPTGYNSISGCLAIPFIKKMKNLFERLAKV